MPDEIDAQIAHARQSLAAGANSFTFGRTVMADLLDQSERLTDLIQHQVAFGAIALLNHLPTQEAQLRFLTETLGAVPSDEPEWYEFEAGGYIAKVIFTGGSWQWTIKGEPYFRSQAIDALMGDG